MVPTCSWIVIRTIGRSACRRGTGCGRTIIRAAMNSAVDPCGAHGRERPPNSGLGTVGGYRQDRPRRVTKGQRGGSQECCSDNQSKTPGISRHIALSIGWNDEATSLEPASQPVDPDQYVTDGKPRGPLVRAAPAIKFDGLFDHFVGEREHVAGYREIHCLCGFHVDDE